MALTKATNSMIKGASVNVLDYGAVGDGVADDTAAIQAAIDSIASAEGVVHIPAGKYKTTAQLTVPIGVSIKGDGRRNATEIYAVHTGNSILNLKGSRFCILEDFYLSTDATTFPKTGIILGRDEAASAGHHFIKNIRIQGYFSKAVIYSIASEVNSWVDIYCWLLGVGADYVFYTSRADDLAVDSLVTSTNLVGNLYQPYFISSVGTGTAACIYIEAAESSGSWNFYGAYLIPYQGSYVHINNATDAQILGGYSFYSCSGERLSGGDPSYGFRLTSSVSCNFKGLTIVGSRFDLLAGTSHYPFWTDNNYTFTTPNVVMQPPEAFPYAVTIYYAANIKGGIFKVAREYDWVAPTLAGTWVNSFGAPYAQVGYSKNGEGRVYLRGSVSSGTGTIFTLPANFRPSGTLFFSTTSGGAISRISITLAGVVTIISGSGTQLDLSGISFLAEN